MSDDQSQQWKDTACATILFSPGVITAWTKAERLEMTRTYVSERKIADRGPCWDSLFNDTASLRAAICQAGLPYVVTMLDLVEEEGLRETLTLQVVQSPDLPRAKTGKSGLIAFMDDLGTRLSPAAHQRQWLEFFRRPDLIAALLENQDVSEICTAAQRIESPVELGTALGAIMSSSAVFNRLRSQGNVIEIAKLANQQTDSKLRSAYLREVLRSSIFDQTQNNHLVELSTAIWDLVLRSSDQDLRRESLLNAISRDRIGILAGDAAGVDQIIAMMEEMNVKDLAAVMLVGCDSPTLVNCIVAQQRFTELIRLVCRLPRQERSTALTNLFDESTHSFQQQPSRTNFIATVIETLGPTDRFYFAVGLAGVPGAIDRYSPKVLASITDALMQAPARSSGEAFHAISKSRTLLAAVDRSPHRRTIVSWIPTASPDDVYAFGKLLFDRGIELEGFLNAGALDVIVASAAKMKDSQATELLSSLVANESVAVVLKRRNQVVRLIQIADSGTTAANRFQVCKALIGNLEAMKQFLEASQLDLLVDAITKHPNAPERFGLLGMLISIDDVPEQLDDSKYQSLVFAFTDETLPLDQRYAVVESMLFPAIQFRHWDTRTSRAVATILQAGRLDELVEFALGQSGSGGQPVVAARLLGIPAVAGPLLESKRLLPLFDAVKNFPELGRDYLVAVVMNPLIVQRLQQSERLKELINLCMTPSILKDGYRNPLYYATPVIDSLIRNRETDLLFDAIRNVGDIDLTTRLLGSLFEGSEITLKLVSAGKLEDLMELVDRHASPQSQSDLIGKLLSGPTVRRLLETERDDTLFRLIDSLQQPGQRRAVVSQVIQRFQGVAELIEAGHQDRLLGWIKSESDPAVRDRWVASLVAANRIDLLFDPSCSELLATLFDPEQITADTVQTVIGNELVVASLAKDGIFYSLVEACDQSPQRLELLTLLLQNSDVIALLDRDNQIDPWVDEIIRDQNRSLRERLFSNIDKQVSLHTILIENGFLPVMLESINNQFRNSDLERRKHLLLALDNPAAVNFLAETGQMGMVTELATQDIERSEQYQLLRFALVRFCLLETILRHEPSGWLDETIKGFTEDEQDELRLSVLGRPTIYWVHSELIHAWIKTNKISDLKAMLDAGPAELKARLARFLSTPHGNYLEQPKMVEFYQWLIAKEDQKSQRISYRNLVNSAKGRWHLLAGGSRETLLEWTETLWNSQKLLKDFRFSTSGEVAVAVYQERLDDAAQILAEHQSDPDGAARIAAFHFGKGDVQEQIQSYWTKDVSPTSISTLAMLYRVTGQPLKAAEIFEREQKVHDAKRLYSIGQDWRMASQLQEAEFARLPSGKQPMLRCQTLCRLALSRYFFGQRDATIRTLEDIKELASQTETPAMLRCFAITLVTCGQTEDGLALLAQCDPLNYLKIQLERDQPAVAMKVLGIDPSNPIQWVQSLQPPSKDAASEFRLEHGMVLAEGLSRLGRNRAADALYAELEKNFVPTKPAGKRVRRPNPEQRRIAKSINSQRFKFARSLNRSGRIEECCRVTAETGLSFRDMNSSVEAVFLRQDEQLDDAPVNWWSFVNSEIGAEMEAIGQKTATLHLPDYPIDLAIRGGEFFASVHQGSGVIQRIKGPTLAVDYVRKLYTETSPGGDRYAAVALGYPLLKRLGQQDQMQSILVASPKFHSGSNYLIDGQMRLMMGQNRLASEQFRKGWERDPSKLDLLMHAALSDANSGGRAIDGPDRRLVSMMAVQPNDRFKMARRLILAGQESVGCDELWTVYRTADIDSRLWVDAAKALLELESDASVKIALLEQLLWATLDQEGVWEVFQYALQRQQQVALAALQKHDLEQSSIELLESLELDPVSLPFSKQVASMLRAAESTSRIDQVRSLQAAAVQQVLNDFPESAHYQNEAAHFELLANRDLKKAAKHCEVAVQQCPQNAQFLGTQAEVFLRQGQVQKAREINQQALRIAPYQQDLLSRKQRLDLEFEHPVVSVP